MVGGQLTIMKMKDKGSSSGSNARIGMMLWITMIQIIIMDGAKGIPMMMTMIATVLTY